MRGTEAWDTSHANESGKEVLHLVNTPESEALRRKPQKLGEIPAVETSELLAHFGATLLRASNCYCLKRE